ncbi:hypothetical protein VNI00_018311, partial [Paramarasmius palmivorus]
MPSGTHSNGEATLIRLDANDQWVPIPSETTADLTIDTDIRRLVCDYCWNTLFTFRAFQSAWDSHT